MNRNKQAVYTTLSLLLLPAAVVQGYNATPLRPITAKDKAIIARTDELRQQGNAALDAGDFRAAEADFRDALELEPWDVQYDQGLAEALTGQGRVKEAISAYRALIYPVNSRIVTSTADELRTRMRYAILLAKTGQWPEAVAIYEKAAPDADFDTSPDWRPDFDVRVPQPSALQAMAYIALGRDESMGGGDHRKAFVEFGQAQRLQPNSVLTNSYYRYGWHQLGPADWAKFGSPDKARAALEKAVRLGKGEVKAAAQKELRVAVRPK